MARSEPGKLYCTRVVDDNMTEIEQLRHGHEELA